GGDRDRRALPVPVIDLLCDGVADIGLARGDHDLGAVLGHALGDRLADAFGRTGDDGDFSLHVEQAHGLLPDFVCLYLSSFGGDAPASNPESRATTSGFRARSLKRASRNDDQASLLVTSGPAG